MFDRHCSFLSVIINTELEKPYHISRFAKVKDSKIGRFTEIGINCSINNAKIEKYCSIAKGVQIGIGRHPIDKISTNQLFYSKNNSFNTSLTYEGIFLEYLPTVIHNDVWIGANAIIFDGVEIGNGAIVSAGSLVHKNVKPYSVVGGNPAEFLFYRFKKETVDLLLELKWWDYPIEKLLNKDVLNLFNTKLDEHIIQQIFNKLKTDI